MTKKQDGSLVVHQDNSAESLIQRAIDKGVPVETMERLLAMRKELKQEQSKEEYDRSMSKFQSDCPIIEKTKKIKNKDGTIRYAYAPIESIVEQVKPILQRHGFSYTIDTKVEDTWVTAICKITHEFGHSEVSSFKVPVDKDGYMSQPQKFASALTFAKRYAFCNAFGILTGDEDDDTQVVVEAEKAKTTLDKLMTLIPSADKAHLKDYINKMQASRKYTDQERAQFINAAQERMKELGPDKDAIS